MASEVSICNDALQLLGAERIVSLTEDSVNARECNACYAEKRDLELEKHRWKFAITRTTLAPDATEPDFDFAYAYVLPAGCLRVLMPARPYLDWQIEDHNGATAILTNEGTSLEVVYVKQITDPNLMVPTFRAALAARMAIQMCERITQSNTKMGTARDSYKEAINEARRTNALQRIADEAPEDTWVSARR
jgi:hypothetical protein